MFRSRRSGLRVPVASCGGTSVFLVSGRAVTAAARAHQHDQADRPNRTTNPNR